MRIVVGLHAAREVIQVRPAAITEIWLKEGADRSSDHAQFIEFAQKKRIRVSFKSDGALSKIAFSHQGVALYVNEDPELDWGEIKRAKDDPEKKILLLALDEITDPHNIGAILRTAWLMDAKGIFVPELRSGHLTPATAKVASGGAEHVPLIKVSNLPNTLKELKDFGFWVYGLSGNAKSTILQTKFPEKTVLVVGSEESGLRTTTERACDELVSIPQTNAAASYNASVAAAIATFEVRRQHLLTK